MPPLSADSLLSAKPGGWEHQGAIPSRRRATRPVCGLPGPAEPETLHHKVLPVGYPFFTDSPRLRGPIPKQGNAPTGVHSYRQVQARAGTS